MITGSKYYKAYIVYAIISMFLLGCMENQVKPIRRELVHTFIVTTSTMQETPFVTVFDNSGSTIKANVYFLILQDGTFIWSSKSEGGAPYYRAKLSPDKMAMLRDDFFILKRVNPQFKFLVEPRPPDYNFAVVNIIDKEMLMNIQMTHYCTVFMGLNFSEGKVMEELQKQGVFSHEIRSRNAFTLCAYLESILKKYVPDEGQIVDDLDFHIKPVEYSIGMN